MLKIKKEWSQIEYAYRLADRLLKKNGKHIVGRVWKDGEFRYRQYARDVDELWFAVDEDMNIFVYESRTDMTKALNLNKTQVQGVINERVWSASGYFIFQIQR